MSNLSLSFERVSVKILSFIQNQQILSKEEFLSKPFYDQLRTLYFDGAFVMAIRYYKYKVNLYLLNGFYIEVFYNHKEDRIDKIAPYDQQSSRTKFYADQVKLPGDMLA